jgi:hypothetical protein
MSFLLAFGSQLRFAVPGAGSVTVNQANSMSSRSERRAGSEVEGPAFRQVVVRRSDLFAADSLH